MAFRVIFQYQEQGGGSFAMKFEARDADDAMRLANVYADRQRRRQQGDFFPAFVESAFSMNGRDYDLLDKA